MTAALGLRDWTPIAVRPDEGTVDWCYSAGVEFDDPFFEQTVERCLRSPFRQLFVRTTPLEALAGVPGEVDHIEPSGFVFHMSRCGSTLVTQMLGAAGSTLALSEASPLERVLGARSRHATEEQHLGNIRGMVAALGQRRSAAQRHLVVKLDAWSVFDLPAIRRAFPETPWVFLFREPVAVLSSQMRQRGSVLVPGVLPESVTGIPFEQAAAMPGEEFCARVLARICEAATLHADDRALFVDYELLPSAVPDLIAGWFGIPCPEADRRRMLDRAGRDAKTPSLPFEPSPPSPAERERIGRAADTHLAPVYERLRSTARRAA